MNLPKPYRSLALLVMLLACAGVGASQQPGQTTDSYLFVSPNTSENLTFDEALRRLNSTEENALVADGRLVACRLRLKARIAKTIGSWTDGAEHSTLLLVRADEETARYANAWLGKRARQKSVLYFQQRAAAAGRMYVLSLRSGRRALAAVAKALDRSGIPDRTLVPGARRTLVYVIDFKNDLQRRVVAAARRLGARYSVLAGTGDFIGHESREQAQTVFSEIVSKFEQAHPPVPNNCGVESSARQASGSAAVVSIAEARRLPPGTLATIEGAVTVPSGLFKSSFSDEGFAVEDRSAGIYVRVRVNGGLRVRERVRVTGRIDESNGLMGLVPADAESVVRLRGRVLDVAAQVVSTGRVNEATEGRLVQVKGMITRAVVGDMPYGSRIFINDGTGEVQIFVNASTQIDVSRFKAGQRLRVTGFSGQYQEHYEIEPRFASDIEPLALRRAPAP